MSGDRRAEIRRADVLGGVAVVHAEIRRRAFPRHFHEEYTLGLVTRGINRFQYRRGQLAAAAGTLCLADPGEVHTGEADAEGWSYWTMLVPATAFARVAADLAGGDARPPDFVSGVIADARAVRRFARLFRVLATPGDPLRQDAAAVEALGHLVLHHSHRPPAVPRAADSAVARRVREVLADRIADPVTLADLEAAVGVGRFRLLRAFRAAYGLPPHAWQVQARLARAYALIRAGRAIADAAVDTGFADQAHLTRLFKRNFGYTPGALARAAPAGRGTGAGAASPGAGRCA
jgi:AraC-like DNA-binding protein